MAIKGRRRYEADPRKIIEELGGNDYELLSRAFSCPSIVSDLATSWLHVQQERLRLAQEHLHAAIVLNETGVPGAIRPEKRAVISRAYYAMFCAARAALSFHENADRNDHKNLPAWVNKAPLGRKPDRIRVVNALNRFRAARNEADYSPFYPRPLGQDAKAAIKEARAVLRICQRWIKDTARYRTSATSVRVAQLGGAT
jgi:uncharacterized protein (UPF0332 family)